jgi:hypothetical protein
MECFYHEGATSQAQLREGQLRKNHPGAPTPPD